MQNKARRSERVLLAQERLSERTKRSPEEQIAILNRRLGVDAGALKERARLQHLIQNPEKKISKNKKNKHIETK